jgi:dTDP-4-amino-4,6-dideoxygalactose transaminase
MNGRLDTIQAAVLLQKLRVFPDELVQRQRVAARYSELLGEAIGERVRTPRVREGAVSAWAQYTVAIAGRGRVAARLRDLGVASAVYYPVPNHRQPAYRAFPRVADLTGTEGLSRDVLSLPFHPYLTPHDQDRVIDALRSAVDASE